MRLVSRAVIAVCAMLFIGTSSADNFPNKPVKLVVPWPAGGGADYVARTFGNELEKRWSQPVIVENITGAGSVVGAGKVAKAAADGHTLMVTINGTLVGNRFLYKQLAYDPDKSFAPITLLVESGQLILANAGIKANTLRELVELAKREPLAYASYGKGTQPHLLFETMNRREGINMLHVPYNGLAPAMQAVISGEAHLTVVSPSSAKSALATGKVKPLAIGSDDRASVLPEVPTVKEAGFPYMRATIWFGLFAPAGMPAALVKRIYDDVKAIGAQPQFARMLTERGFAVVLNESDRFAAAIRQEVNDTAEMVKIAGVSPQ